MVELAWWGLALIVLATIIVYTIVLLVVYRGFVKGQKGRFLFNLPLAPFSVKSRVYTIAKQVGANEEDIKYIGDNIYMVNGVKYSVEGFFGVVVYVLDDDKQIIGAVKSEVSEYNLTNLRVGSGEIEAGSLKQK